MPTWESPATSIRISRFSVGGSALADSNKRRRNGSKREERPPARPSRGGSCLLQAEEIARLGAGGLPRPRRELQHRPGPLHSRGGGPGRQPGKKPEHPTLRVQEEGVDGEAHEEHV